MRLKAALLTVAVAAALAGPALAGMTVPVDQTRRLTLSSAAADVMVGNPAIADVSMIDERNLFVMGRSYGVTNIIVLDRAGRTIWEGQVNVSPPDSAQVSLYRGARVANLACSPRCERTPMPGESEDVYEPYGKSYTSYNERAVSGVSASGKTPPPPPAGGEGR